jgi:hypothetical protein
VILTTGVALGVAAIVVGFGVSLSGDLPVLGAVVAAAGMVVAVACLALKIPVSRTQVEQWNSRRRDSRTPAIIAGAMIVTGVAMIAAAGVFMADESTYGGIALFTPGGLALFSGVSGLRARALRRRDDLSR